MDHTDIISSLSKGNNTSVTTTNNTAATTTKRNKSSKQVKNSVKSTNNTPNNASNDTEMPEFDLRAAVLYSAILSPKFKEEDIY